MKKTILNSMVGLFFLYVVWLLDKELLNEKEKYKKLLAESAMSVTNSYSLGYNQALNDFSEFLKSLNGKDDEPSYDPEKDATRYS